MEKHWYDRIYKIMLLVPILILVGSLVYLWNFQSEHGDLIYKDVTLTGGTTITVLDSSADINRLRAILSPDFPDLMIRTLSDFATGEQRGFIIETQAEVSRIRTALEAALGYELKADNSSIEFSGASLSQGFYKQLRFAIFLAFVFMAITVLLIFADSIKIKIIALFIILVSISGFALGNYIMGLLGLVFFIYLCARYSIPSIAVIFAALSDIVMTIVVVNIIGIPLSTAGVVAFLLLIGYSVDTDILLTTRVLKKREGSINERIFGSFKTGIMMTLTSIAAIGVSLVIVYNSSEVLRQMFIIILIGLGFDILNTWFTNASILKWYAEYRENKK